VTFTAFFLPADSGGLTWGVGPVFLLPRANNTCHIGHSLFGSVGFPTSMTYHVFIKSQQENRTMKLITVFFAAMVLTLTQLSAIADPDDRQDRRQERGRSDERQDKRECRREEGVVGKDKRECKQENRGEDGDDDKDEAEAEG